MNNVSVGSTAFANFVTPFSPVGKQAVGQENVDAKESSFSPLEESSETAQTLNRDDETINPDQQSGQQQSAKQDKAEQEQQLQQDQQQIRQLAARDREVRAHEAAHAAVGGQYAGAASFQFVRGPDGVNYAAGGEVPISLPRGGEPGARLVAAEQVRRAALAPANPSAQDRSIAALAAQTALGARAEISTIQAQARQGSSEESSAVRAEKQAELEKEKEAQSAQQKQLEQQQAQQQSDKAESARRLANLSNALVGLEDDKLVGSILDQRA
jgi:hypothetical protein